MSGVERVGRNLPYDAGGGDLVKLALEKRHNDVKVNKIDKEWVKQLAPGDGTMYAFNFEAESSSTIEIDLLEFSLKMSDAEKEVLSFKVRNDENNASLKTPDVGN